MLRAIAKDSMKKIRISYKYKSGMPNRNQEKNKPWFNQDWKEAKKVMSKARKQFSSAVNFAQPSYNSCYSQI